MKDVRDYLANEQAIARDPGTPEWQVMNQLNLIAGDCTSVEQFLEQARAIEIDGPEGEVKEAQQWLTIALETIEEQ